MTGRRTSFRVDDSTRRLLTELLERDGITERRKSAWICAAVKQLVTDDERLASVGAGEDLVQFTYPVRIQIDEATEQAIDKAVRLIRASDYRSEGLQGAILRAAIRHAARRSTLDTRRATVAA